MRAVASVGMVGVAEMGLILKAGRGKAITGFKGEVKALLSEHEGSGEGLLTSARLSLSSDPDEQAQAVDLLKAQQEIEITGLERDSSGMYPRKRREDILLEAYREWKRQGVIYHG